MDIIVCVKQVPGSSNVKVDEKTGVLIRNGIDTKMNPFDLFALETALQIKNRTGAKVVALTMGPTQAQDVLREAFSMGADDGILLTDKKFAGADVLATAYTISQGIEKVGIPDLILCGRQTTDGDTAQVGPEVAEFLNIPHVSNVLAVHAVTEEGITLDQDLPDCIQTVTIPFPCLLTVEKDIFQPRLPSYVMKQRTLQREIRQFGISDLDDREDSHYGLNGSPTRVVKIFPPQVEKNYEVWEGSAPQLGKGLYDLLSLKKFI